MLDPGAAIRMTTVDPDSLPRSHEIENFPESARYGTVELVLNYYRTFPGDEEYNQLAEGSLVMRFHLEEELDEDTLKQLKSLGYIQ